MSNNTVPAMEFISTRHTSHTVEYMISTFLSDVRQFSRGKNSHPKEIVTDFSYPLINAVLNVYNNQKISDYLKMCSDIMLKKYSAAKIKSRTFLFLCCAHMIKSVSRRLYIRERKMTKRKVCLVIFAKLQRCLTIEVRRLCD